MAMCMAKAAAAMPELDGYQYALIAGIFIWSGFVRSGLGFGGALFTLPFLLLIHNDPLIFLPIISIHLLFFAGLTIIQAERQPKGASDNQTTVNWAFVRYRPADYDYPQAGRCYWPAGAAHRINEHYYLLVNRRLLPDVYPWQTHAEQ